MFVVSFVFFRGASLSGNTSDAVARLEELKLQQIHLEEEEKRLEEQFVRMEQCLRNLAEDTVEDQYPSFNIITLSLSIFSPHTLILTRPLTFYNAFH